MIDVLKEYLVSLGFSVDSSSLNQARRAMSSAEDSVSQFSNSSITSFAKVATGIATFVAAANLALAKFVVDLAQADLQTEMFARKMWMSKDAAKAYQSSIDALGVSLNDLYLSPELMNKYLALNGQARGMAVPTDEYNKQMQGIRDITFQFQRLKLEGTYALQWIGYYLTKYLAGPMGDLKSGLADVNAMIQKNLPKWSEKVALVVSWFVRMGLAAWKIRYAIGAVMAAFTAFKLIGVLSNPFGLMILGLTALLLLIDDFTTWQDGGESAFPKLWEWVDKLQETMKASGLDFNTFKKDLENIAKSAADLEKTLDGLVEKLGIKGGLAEVIRTGILSTLELLDGVLKSINMGIKELNGLITGEFSLGDIASGKADKKFESEPEDNGKPIFGFLDDAALNAIKELRNFFSKHSFSVFKSGISPMSYMYPQNTTSRANQITNHLTTNVYGATQPAAVATQVSRSNNAMLTRTFQGVIR